MNNNECTTTNRTHEEFENDVVRLYEQIQEFCRIVPCVPEKNYSNIFLNPTNGISYDTLKKMAPKIRANEVLNEEEIESYNLMYVAYNAGAFQTEIMKFQALLSYLVKTEHLSTFVSDYESILYVNDKQILGSRCKQLIEHLDRTDSIIMNHMHSLNYSGNDKEILDMFKEFIYFNEGHLLRRYFTSSFQSFSLAALIYAIRELSDICPFITDLYKSNGRVRLSEIDFITMRVLSESNLSISQFKTNIMGMNKIQMILQTNAQTFLKSGLYNSYRDFASDFSIAGLFGCVSGRDLINYANMIQNETKPLIEFKECGYDNMNSSDYDSCYSVMNVTTPLQVTEIADKIIAVACDKTEFIQNAINNLINSDIRTWLNYANNAADIVYIHDMYEVTNAKNPLSDFIKNYTEIVDAIRNPMGILYVDSANHFPSVDAWITKVKDFLAAFSKLDIPDIKRHSIGGSESKNAENDEKKLTSDDIYYDLTKVICCHPLLDLASNSLIILSKYIPSKEAFITPCESNVDVKPILRSIKWKDEFAMELLHNTIYEAFNDGVMKNNTNNQGITTGIFNDFILYSYQTIQLVDMLAKRKMADETPEKRFEICRNYIVDLFLDHVEKNEIIFFDCKKRSTLRNIIIDEIFLQFTKDIEDNYMINCCTILAVLLNGYINKDYRYGVLKTRVEIAFNLYNFIVQNMSEINSELVKK